MNRMMPSNPINDGSLDFREKFLKQALNAGFFLDDRQLDLFTLYYRELIFWNRQMNLVSERSVEEIAERHFIDSLTALPFVRPECKWIVDLGSGGGFPGIPLKIMLPDMKVLLLDSSRKKISFLAHVIAKLELKHITAEQCRIEDLAQDEKYRAAFDCAVSRAAFKLDLLVLFSHPLLNYGGRLVAMKGPEMVAEFKEAEKAAKTVGMELQPDAHLTPSLTNSNRKIIIYTSTRPPFP
jgi:16S rRNA (guanine527-N7)-methyltransferase